MRFLFGKKKSLTITIIDFFLSIQTNKNIRKIIHECNDYDFNTSSLYDLWINYKYINKIIKNNIKGDIVECGIWKGISVVFFQKILDFYKVTNKNIYGFDTFEGFPEPTERDVTIENISMMDRFNNLKINKNSSNWNNCSFENVNKNILSSRINTKNLKLIKGKVENTLTDENNLPNKISILKLDTCLYESTKMELEVLFPRIQKGGVLIIDNYQNFKGVQYAVEKYFNNKKFKLNFKSISGQIIIEL